MDKTIKQKLLIYGIISGFLFTYLIMSATPGISMVIYACIQLLLILYLIKDRTEIKNKRALIVFVPVVILSLKYFISDSYTFSITNFLVIFVLYSTMILMLTNQLEAEKQGVLFIKRIIITIFKPILYFGVPLKWFIKRNKDNAKGVLAKKILIGIAISAPCVLIIISMLMSADLVFENTLVVFFGSFDSFISPLTLFNAIFGILAGLYLFGLFYIIFHQKKEVADQLNNEATQKAVFKPQGDVIILNVILVSILIIYTVFAVIQFKYLFAGAALPNNLTYAEYARRGFFELLFLSFINIGIILLTIYLASDKIYGLNSISSKLIRILMIYLCAITVLLLISSFYRMVLYNNEYGFTELRLLVSIFLVFEAIGLLITFYYIIKPKFNIIAYYAVICLVFYLSVNVINLDYFIAKKNIDMYYEEGRDLDANYLVNRSADAASQMKRLLESDDIEIKSIGEAYFNRLNESTSYINDWKSFNLSRYLFNKLKISN